MRGFFTHPQENNLDKEKKRLSVECLFLHGEFEHKDKMDLSALRESLKQFREGALSSEVMRIKCVKQFEYDEDRLSQHDSVFDTVLNRFLDSPEDMKFWVKSFSECHFLMTKVTPEDLARVLVEVQPDGLVVKPEMLTEAYLLNISSNAMLLKFLIIQKCMEILLQVLEIQPDLVNLQLSEVHGHSLLHNACEFLDPDAVALLIEKGHADVNMINTFSHSPLLTACQNAYKNPTNAKIIIEKLLSHGANPTLESSTSYPFHFETPEAFCKTGLRYVTEFGKGENSLLLECYQTIIDAAEQQAAPKLTRFNT